MFFQKIIKGINGLSQATAEDIMKGDGIFSNWWLKKGGITNREIRDELTELNLKHHLDHYNKPLPPGHKWQSLGTTYGEVSAFISLAAGIVDKDDLKKMIVPFPAFLTALKFATKGFTTDGHLFYSYVITIGKKAIPLEHFSEEVRELNIYNYWRKYHQQGEITAKICIPTVQIEKLEFYTAAGLQQAFSRYAKPVPASTVLNPNYQPPDDYNNIKDFF